ncbi:hypothetical protein [Nocardiopsis ganjiahuensis]|uniref:hypothetical protein n=1 Tax=Nocardiopsis ganjiahuensis TaxID=239984 RepID=UPI00034996F0|nr:hypothetical protein [Nocardiopsis ganjiahuensis]
MKKDLLQAAILELSEALQQFALAINDQEEFEAARVRVHQAFEGAFAWEKKRRGWLNEQHIRIDSMLDDPDTMARLRREAGIPDDAP